MPFFKNCHQISDDTDPLLSKVVARGKVDIQIDYPIQCNPRFRRSRKTWTGADVVNEVRTIYQKFIYKSHKSEHQYGVWGHDIGDLVVEGFSVRKRAGKPPLITLNIGS